MIIVQTYENVRDLRFLSPKRRSTLSLCNRYRLIRQLLAELKFQLYEIRHYESIAFRM